MFHRIKSINPLPNKILKVKFENGAEKKYNLEKAIKRWPQFRALENENFFRSAAVAPGGFGVIWNESLDLSCDELWEGGTKV